MAFVNAGRAVGQTGLQLPPLGFGAFKIGRNQGIKYPQGYALPTDAEATRLLQQVLDLGCTYIDTAPAYGLSEERIGRALASRRAEFVLSTKVGETFADGASTYDFSAEAITGSLERSRQRLSSPVLDLVWIHSPGNDETLLRSTDVVDVLRRQRDQGTIRAIGLSCKTVGGAELALAWADALMVEYHSDYRDFETVMHQASDQGVAVVVKKGLASGHLPPAEAIRFVLAHPAVTSLVVGGLNIDHFRTNWQTALAARGMSAAT